MGASSAANLPRDDIDVFGESVKERKRMQLSFFREKLKEGD